MVVGILQVRLRIDAPTSLKDKRRVVSSLKDRLHREHQVSVAETDDLQDMHFATLGLAAVTNDARRCQAMLDRILDKLRGERGYTLVDSAAEVLTGVDAKD